MAQGHRRRSRRGRPVAHLTVLGSSCSIPRPGRACSSYLIDFQGTAIVADLGTGAFANLVAHQSLRDLDALVISHMHADHFIDVVPLRYALKYGDDQRDAKLPLYLPPGGEIMLHAITAAFHPEVDNDFLSVFDVRVYDPASALRVGSVDIRFAAATHYIPTYAMRFSSEGTSIAYSSDTAPNAEIEALARGSDLFVCEATLSNEAEGETPRGHSSARQAAAMAQNAETDHLVLSHYPATLDPAEMARHAREAFHGRLTIADDGLVISL